MSIADAWKSSRPIFSRLPGVNGAYSENLLADWLTNFWDGLLISTKEKIEDIPRRQLNPLTADPEWLDFLAPLAGWDSQYWSSTYPVEGKRQLLANSFNGLSVWENKGTQEVLSFVLTQVGVRNKIIIPGNFFVGISELGDELGDQPWEFDVYLPQGYQGTPKETLARKIVNLFAPAWCDWELIFNDDPFLISQLLATDEEEVITDRFGNGIKVGETL